MKIAKIIIPNFQQFKGFELDLTYPEGHAKAGQPLEKVCFIGRNGTGKSTLLRFINELVEGFPFKVPSSYAREPVSFITQIITKQEVMHLASFKIQQGDSVKSISRPFLVPNSTLNKIITWAKQGKSDIHPEDIIVSKSFNNYSMNAAILRQNLDFTHEPSNLLVYSSTESGNGLSGTGNTPDASLNEALKLFSNFPVVHNVSAENINDFWRLLIFHIKKRESNLLAYQDRIENQEKTLKQVKEEFNREHPEVLKEIADLWNQILENAGLEFDYQNAKAPVQLTDNLLAYIKVKSSGETIPYNALSTGIRNFIFRLGHIYALYFNRRIESGFLLIDEPENSLFPDFLYDLVDIYQSIIHNTQFFVATHSPYLMTEILEQMLPDEEQMGELAVFVAYYEDYQTKVKQLSDEEIRDIRNNGIDVFYNLSRFTPGSNLYA